MIGILPQLGQSVAVLSQIDLEQVHNTSLEILNEVGIRFQGGLGVKELSSYDGIRCDGDLVHFSKEFIEWVIKQAPSEFTLYAQNQENDVVLGKGRVHYSSGFGATFFVDRAQQIIRPATLKDTACYLTLAEALDNVHLVLTPFVPQDIDPDEAEVGGAILQFLLTTKHVGIGVPNAENLELLTQIGDDITCYCGRPGPVYSFGATINSPLVISDSMQQKIIFAAKRAIPLRIVSGAIAGITAPVTLAGALATQNAEVLAGIALAQAVNPGCPVIYGTFAGGMDMRTGKWAASAPETVLMSAASSQLCRFYGIPLAYGTGGVSDSLVPDERAGIEKGLSLLANALSQVEVIHDGVSGLLAGGMAISLEQFVVDNEIAHWVNRYLQGIVLGEKHLALQAIQDVGPGRSFIAHEHTAQYCRQEHMVRPYFQRNHRLEWPSVPGSSMLEQASKWIDKTHSFPRITEIAEGTLPSIRDNLLRTNGNHSLYEKIMSSIEI